MFGTLKHDVYGEEAYVIETTEPPFISNKGKGQHSACIPCRAKKLGCTGEEAGCRRCHSKGIKCSYPKHGHRKTPSQQTSNKEIQRHKRPSLGQKSELPLPDCDQGREAEWDAASDRPSGGGESTSSVPQNTSNGPASIIDGAGSMVDPILPDLSGDDAAMLDQIDLLDFATEYLDQDYMGDIDVSIFAKNTSEPAAPEHRSQPCEPTQNPLFDWTGPTPTSNGQDKAISWQQNSILPQQQHSSTNSSSPELRFSVTSSETSCSCVRTSLDIFERLVICTRTGSCKAAANSVDLRYVDMTLKFKKHALTQWMAALECANCSGHSALVMLLLSGCEQMLSSLEQICRAFTSSTRSVSSNSAFYFSGTSQFGTGMNPEPERTTETGVLTLDTEDRVHVLTALVISRMKHLEKVLRRLRVIVTENHWQEHGEILVMVEGRFRATAAGVKRLD